MMKKFLMYSSIQFTMGTDVKITFNTLGPGLPKNILMQYCRARRELQ